MSADDDKPTRDAAEGAGGCDDLGIVLSALRFMEDAVGEKFDDEGGVIAQIERDHAAGLSAIATPQLAPDAVRALLWELRAIVQIHVPEGREALFARIDAALSAPVPSPDRAQKIDDDELTGWARSWHWNDCAGEPADPSIYFRDIRMLKAFIAYCERIGVTPSATGAAEPVAHYHRPSTTHMGDCAICGNVSDHPLHIGSPSFATPREDREELIRVALKALGYSDLKFPAPSFRKDIETIIDAVLSLPAQPGADERHG